ncbi:MAG: Ni/Fe hydrogenase, partial [Thermoanaerobaculia bacterium]
NWPIGCGHPCIGCAEPDFWDKMTPFYQHLQGIPGFGVASKVDRVGLLATAGVGAAFAAHGLISLARRWRSGEPLHNAPEPPEKTPTPKGDRP